MSNASLIFTINPHFTSTVPLLYSHQAYVTVAYTCSAASQNMWVLITWTLLSSCKQNRIWIFERWSSSGVHWHMLVRCSQAMVRHNTTFHSQSVALKSSPTQWKARARRSDIVAICFMTFPFMHSIRSFFFSILPFKIIGGQPTKPSMFYTSTWMKNCQLS